MLAHGLSHLESRVHKYAVSAVEHLRVHAAHGRADDEVGLLLLLHLTQHGHALHWMKGYVFGNDGGLGQQRAEHRDRARLG